MRHYAKLLRATLTASLVTIAGAVVSQRNEPTPEASALQKVLYAKTVGDFTNDLKWRRSLAAALHGYCESVLKQVPRNTPEEDRWVDDEIKDLGLFPVSTPETN